MSQIKNLTLQPEFVKEIAEIMLRLTGVQFFDRQSGMIQSRLFKRMLELNIKDPAVYLRFLKENYDSESKILVSLLTTHHTFFFREFFHFEFLLKEGLAKAIQQVRAEKQNKIRIWSAACSQGQEVYSLAMFLDYHLPQMAPDIGYEILGTDIDIDCIKIAKNGVYRFEQIKEIPILYQGNNWQKGTGQIENFVRIKDHLRQHCQFVTSNLFDMSLLMGQTFHFIFCRNVFIYFNQEQINNVSKNLFNLLNPGGYLFLGLSESLNGSLSFVEQVGASVYQKNETSKQSVMSPNVNSPDEEDTKPSEQVMGLLKKEKIRVVCVDDSPVIITLLKKILSNDHGFEVVGTASNGMEARDVINTHKPDIVTLDIHMPQMTGVDYLRQFFSDKHPPVVMVSSVSREEAEFGVQSFDLGAIDFVEKPTLSNLNEKADEIRTKLRCAVAFDASSKRESNLDLIKKFKTDFSSLGQSGLVRVCVASLGELQKIKLMISQLGENHPTFVILLHGAESFVPLLLDRMRSESLKVKRLEDHVVLRANQIYFSTFDKFDTVKKMLSSKNPAHLFVLGATPTDVTAKICRASEFGVFLEENLVLQNQSNYQMIKRLAHDTQPYTSLIYHSSKMVVSQTKKMAA